MCWPAGASVVNIRSSCPSLAPTSTQLESELRMAAASSPTRSSSRRLRRTVGLSIARNTASYAPRSCFSTPRAPSRQPYQPAKASAVVRRAGRGRRIHRRACTVGRIGGLASSAGPVGGGATAVELCTGYAGSRDTRRRWRRTPRRAKAPAPSASEDGRRRRRTVPPSATPRARRGPPAPARPGDGRAANDRRQYGIRRHGCNRGADQSRSAAAVLGSTRC